MSEPAGTEVVRAEAPPRRRRRWLGWLIAVGILVVILVAAALVGDGYARQVATEQIRTQLVSVLGLPDDAEVGVDLGPGSVLLQAARGSLDEVTVDIDRLPVGPVTASARFVATAVPLDAQKPLGRLDALVTIPESQVRTLAGQLSGVELESIELGDGVIGVSTTLTLLGFLSVPVSIDLAPSAENGAVGFTPTTITVNGAEASVPDLAANPLVGALAGDLLRTQSFCVASSLPKALTVTAVSVVGTDLQVTLEAADVALGGEGFSSVGECSKK